MSYDFVEYDTDYVLIWFDMDKPPFKVEGLNYAEVLDNGILVLSYYDQNQNYYNAREKHTFFRDWKHFEFVLKEQDDDQPF